jgi:2-succinyl-5-enolpyruvyl-6-hydroxy-3-cyclohexene-1-carboxylate synthase
MAAAGHYGNKSPLLVQHYATDLGYEYYSASNKDELLKVKNIFLSAEPTTKPILLEVFTDSQDESDALEIMLNLLDKKKDSFISSIKKDVKSAFKSAVGDARVQGLRMIINNK